MANAVVSMVLEKLLSIPQEWLTEEISLVKGVKKELESVSSKLHIIRNVLDDAEKRSIKEKTVQGWLEKLEDISYEMDDVIDEWNTAISKRKIEEDENQISSSSLFSCFSLKQVGLRRDIAREIKDINARLDSILRDKNDFNLVSREPLPNMSADSWESKRITTSLIKESEVYGRDFDKDTLLNKLFSEDSQEQNRIPIISILGVGGLGKTTLAQLVYNSDEVGKRFSKTIWVCVSDIFDPFQIASEIVEAIEGNPPNVSSKEMLLQHLKQSISNETFLLVLDDVWNVDGKKWEQLRNYLEFGNVGSRILVTTRSEKVARMMGTSTPYLHRLSQLSDSACWSLFNQIAFAEKRGRDYEMLRGIGRDIIQKCKGLPLAVRTLGNLLCFKNTVEEWQHVLDSEIWQLEEVEVELFPHLYLSYNELPLSVKRCFSYCSIFPKDTRLQVDELIGIWVAQGFIRPANREHDAELKGQDYFYKLAMCSFFQDFERDEDSGEIISCKMHDIVHDFAQYLTRNECIITADVKPNSFSKRARHLTWLPDTEIETSSFPLCDMKRLRSFFGDGHSLKQPVNLLNCLKCVRALTLRRCDLRKVPKEIGYLVLLRYLDLSGNASLDQLPESVCELYNLQTLYIHRCWGLSVLPQKIGKLVNLRHFKIEPLSLRECPESFGKLTNLRTLTNFLVGSKFGKLEYLKHFKHLRGNLTIVFDTDLIEADAVADAKKAELKNKKYIQELCLNFKDGEVASEAMLEALEPPSNLQCLGISGFFGTQYPSWLMKSLNNLRVLSISHFPNCSTLPPLWKLPYLEDLDITLMRSIKHIGREFLGIDDTITPGDSLRSRAPAMSSSVCAFPKLVNLSFSGLEQWEEWEDLNQEDEDTNIEIMPRLRQLKLAYCPKLDELPDRLLHKVSSLEYLEIWSCGISHDGNIGSRRVEQLLSHIPKMKVNGLTRTPDSTTETFRGIVDAVY